MSALRRTLALAGAILCAAHTPRFATAADLIVSANDAKYVRVDGRDTYPADAGPDTLTLLDASAAVPRVLASVEVHHTLAGPPQAAAISPDGRLAFVAAPNIYDRTAGQVVLENFLQVIDLTPSPPRVIERIDLGAHPQGLAINRAGTLLLATTLGGTVAVLTLHDGAVHLADQLQVAQRRLAGISFTHDGTAALVALRDEQGLDVLAIDHDRVTLTPEHITTGIAPYCVDVSSDGHWAVVSNAGLAALPHTGPLVADADSFTLIDVSRRPFRAVQHVTVPSIPEGVALSPDGHWIAVQSMAGSNLPPHTPGYHSLGRVQLFAIRDGKAVQVSDLPGGQAAQGIVFTADSRRVLVQFNVEKQIAVYEVSGGRLRDTGERIPIPGGPASIRSMPR